MSLALLGFQFARPDAAAWLLAAPALLLLGAAALRGRRRALARMVDERQRARFAGEHSRTRAWLRVLLASGAALFGALALLGPLRGFSLRDVSRKGLDIVVCLDSSRSMLVQDVKPDRLTRAKREVKGLLARLRGDRAALVAFAGDVRLVSPLTHDRETLGYFVDSVSPEDNLVGGTNLGAALEKALELFDGRTGAHEAVVLLTDGEDLEGHGLEVARRAAERGIHVYVVGMGTEHGGKIPDGARGFVKDVTGQEVVSALDGSTLEAIASETGGAYLSVTRSPIPLEEMYEQRMTKLEARELWAGRERIEHDRFQWPLAVAFVLMLAEATLRERRPRRAREGGTR